MGVDFSGEMIRRVRIKHPEIYFIQAEAHDLKISQKFDFIILSELVNDLQNFEFIDNDGVSNYNKQSLCQKRSDLGLWSGMLKVSF